MKKFNKDSWLIRAKDEFKSRSNSIIQNEGYLEFTRVLGEVIESSFKEYNKDNDLFVSIGYPEDMICEIYEFDKENFDIFFSKDSFLKTYKDALGYFSLNSLFLDNFQEELEEFVDELNR